MFYPQLFEEASLEKLNFTNPKKPIKEILVSNPKFNNKYGNASDSSRVANNNRIDIETFLNDVVSAIDIFHETYNVNITKVDGPSTLDPTEETHIVKNINKNPSSSFPAVEFSIEGEKMMAGGKIAAYRWDIILILAGEQTDKATKTPIEVKEGMVNYFFTVDKKFEPLTTSNLKTENKQDKYSEALKIILNDIETKGIPGIDDKDLDIIYNHWKMETKYNVKMVHTLNNAIAIGNWLRDSKYKSWEIKRDEFFKELKKKVSRELGFEGREEDKWNPMDLMLIKPGSEGEINSRLQEAFIEEDEELKLGKINSLFVDEIDSNNPESLILAISLKEEKAQAGKATSYFKQGNPENDLSKNNAAKNLEKEIGDYKLTDEEKKWPASEYLKNIIIQRDEIQTILSNQLEVFNYSVDEIDGFPEQSNYYSKYGALKILNYILKRAEHEDNIFTNIVRYGLSLSKNPTFFKFIGNEKGDSSKVESDIEVYPPRAGLQLYNKKTDSYDGKILIKDKNTNAGLEIVYAIEFTGEIYDVIIQIRSNQGKKPNAPVVVEINKWHKSEDLNEEELFELFYPRLFMK